MSERWYVVANRDGDGECLVEANNKAQALRRCAQFYCTAKAAEVTDTIRIMGNGGDVIRAQPEEESQAQLDLDETPSTVTNEGGEPAPLPAGPLAPEPNFGIGAPVMKPADQVFTGSGDYGDD